MRASAASHEVRGLPPHLVPVERGGCFLSLWLSGELERAKKLGCRGEEGRELISRQFSAVQQDDDGLSSHVQGDEPERLSLLEPQVVREASPRPSSG